MPVAVKNFSKEYKNFLAVSDVSFECEEGKITGILGPNGAGKTTILKAISARHLPTSGEILVDGKSVAEETEMVRNLTGFVTEEPEMPPEYKVFEYLDSVSNLHSGSSLSQESLKSELFEKKNQEAFKRAASKSQFCSGFDFQSAGSDSGRACQRT